MSMRGIVGGLAILVCLSGAFGQENKSTKRYGVEAELDFFPQDTPKNTLESVLKAIERKRITYLLAQLADPKFVDERVKSYGGNFDELVAETAKKLKDDPASVKELYRFLKEGEWEAGDGTATAKLKEVKDRQVFMRKIGERWFLENRMKPEPEA